MNKIYLVSNYEPKKCSGALMYVFGSTGKHVDKYYLSQIVLKLSKKIK
jgi:hypothetical protein